MKKISLIIMSVCAFIPSLFAQSVISVSGKSEMSITPDEVHLLLTEKEYHSIDFKGKVFIDYGDYSSNINFNQSLYESTLPDDKFQFTVSDKVYEGKKKDIKYTLVDINTLEDRLIRAAVKAGISKDNIKITDIGDYWRWRNGPFLVSRQYDLKITDPVQLNKFISSLDKQGVTSISFGELKNKDMEQYDRKGRIQALENARDKATYMVCSESIPRTCRQCPSVPYPPYNRKAEETRPGNKALSPSFLLYRPAIRNNCPHCPKCQTVSR